MDHATSNKKKRWRCRCLQSKKERKNGKEENKENYDEEELVMIYLNQKHDTIKKYPKHDEVLMPLVVFLNNRIDYQGKKKIIKGYGFNETESVVPKTYLVKQVVGNPRYK